MAKKEGQKAWQAWVDAAHIQITTPWAEVEHDIRQCWATVERTIANEALRRAAEVADDYADHYLGGSEGLAAAILALIKEPRP